MDDRALYVSPSSVKSLWQEYRVFADRLELATLLGVMTIPFSKIERISEREPLLKQLATGEIFCREFRPGIKLDFVDFTDHVEIDRTDGVLVRRVLVTPSDPAAFVAAVQSALAAWRASRGGAGQSSGPADGPEMGRAV